MKGRLEILRLGARTTIAIALIALRGSLAVAADASVSLDDLRFASQLGTSPLANTSSPPTSPPLRVMEFGGTSDHSCATLDLDTFLRQFDPRELLAELRQSLLSGAQAEISNYLIALAYSAPTLASVLDMTDRQLHARFTAFAQTCANQQSRAVGLQEPERRLAQASDQCYARETSRGTAPTDAYRLCTLARSFDALALPATLTTLEFLRQHTTLSITPQIQALLAMLPDERIFGGNYQVHPPGITLVALSDALRARSRSALDQAVSGVPLTNIDECAADSILSPNGPACLPPFAFGFLNSPAFRGARMLSSASLSMFKDALAGQIAMTAIYSDLLDLGQQIATMNLRVGSDASASEILSRQRALKDHVARLLDEAELRFKLEQSKIQLARTQLLALERSSADLQMRADALQAQDKQPTLSVTALLQWFRDLN